MSLAIAAAAGRLKAQEALEALHPATIRIAGTNYTVAAVAKEQAVLTGDRGRIQARTLVIHARCSLLADTVITDADGLRKRLILTHVETGIAYRLTGAAYKDSLGIAWRLEAVEDQSA